MQKLKRLYRNNYAGENIVTQLSLVDGEWNPETEFVPNNVLNSFVTSQAIAIGNGESRADFDINYIINHQGGLLAKDKLQTYACNAAYRDFTPDFLIATGDTIVAEIANSHFCDKNIAYTSAKNVLKYPGKFYLIPQNISFNAGAIAAYMACFDGHKKVFLMGYDQYDEDSFINNIYKDTNGYPKTTDRDNGRFYATSLFDVMQTYSDVEFIRIMTFNNYHVPDEFKSLVNFRQIDYREFIYEADIGVLSS
jgi:hypothetical protein